MKKTTIMLLAPAVLLSMSAVGCRTPQRCPPRPCGVAQPCAPAPFPSPPNGFPGTRPGLSAPVVPPPALPPGAIPATPPPGLPPGAGAGQKVEYRWYPADSQVQLAPPEPVKPDDPSKDRILFTPKEPAQPAPAKVEPPVVRDTTSPPLPVGIPQFATVRDKVTAGLRPSLDDGLDWLQKNGYRTVLFIRAPGEDDNTDRKQAEKRGLAYLTLEVSPQTFNKQMVDDFNRLVGDAKLRPLFVYDRDGSLAGGLWYLHFRQVEQLPDDAARIRANALGLKENADGTHRLMWLAVQKYLGEAGR